MVVGKRYGMCPLSKLKLHSNLSGKLFDPYSSSKKR